jgi:hypothetical protein
MTPLPRPENNRKAPRIQYPIVVRTFVLDDASNQYFEVDTPAIGTCGGSETAGYFVYLDQNGMIDPCFIYGGSPAETLLLQTNGVDNPLQNILNLISGANITLTADNFGGVTISASGTVSTAFNDITSGVNTQATMVVGEGASITVSCPNPGVVEATELATDTCTPVVTNLSAPAHAGQLLISQPGNASAVWADPLVQGLYPPGTNVNGVGSPPAPINPVLMGGAACDGTLTDIATTTDGEIIAISQDQETAPNVQRFAVTTGVSLFTNPTSNLIPLLSIQPQTGATSIVFTLRNLEVFGLGQLCHFQLLLNATLTGANFVNVDPDSNMTYDLTATSYTGGRLIDAGDLGATRTRNEYEFVFRFSGSNPPTITLVFAPVTGGRCASAGCSFAWDEQNGCL